MAVNKVEVNGETKLDLTQDTVTPETLLSGVTAHNAAGEEITGLGDFATKTEAQGYVADHNQSADAHSDIRNALNGKEASGTAAAAVTAHNKDSAAHADIREAVSKAGKPFIIEGTLAEDGTTISVDKTHAEVKAAVQAGEPVMLRIVGDGYAIDLALTQSSFTDDAGAYYFGAVVSGLFLVALSYDGTQSQAVFMTTNIPSLSDAAPSAPGTASAGTSNKAARADHVHPSERPKAAQVTLTAAGWNASTKKQTVTVSGVLADTSKQVIWVAVASETALDAYMDAGIVPVAQGANTVTFRADKVPTADISVTVLMQGVLT